MKSILDRGFGFVLFLALLPLFALITISSRCTLGGGVVFRQKRSGYKGNPFVIYKFRTMNNEKDDLGQLLPDKLRLQGFGRWLRSVSLDELPQLLNVIKGDMSFVGPRPQLIEFLPLYNTEQKRRHDVKPGITGWAQVNGRNAISWQEKFKLDIWYVDNRTFWLDLKIVWLTLLRVIKRTDIHSVSSSTMEKFTGNSPH